MSLLSPSSWFSARRQSLSADRGQQEWENRLYDYSLWEAAYRNTLYKRQREFGFREIILREELDWDCTYTSSNVPMLRGHWNPVPQIVDLYQNMLPGQYGVDIAIAPKVDGRDVNPVFLDPVKDPLGKLWRKSNLETEKGELQRLGANLGTAGIRTVADPETRSVYLKFDHPSKIKLFQADSRNNVLRVVLEYKEWMLEDGDRWVEVEVVEEYDEESFSIRFNDVEQLEPEQRVNPLGFCPYVLYRFKGTSGYGDPAHGGDLEPVNAVNWLLTNQDQGTYENIRPKWFLTASGAAPEELDLGGTQVMYVKTTGDGPQPTVNAIVPDIDYAGVDQVIQRRVGAYRQRHPETVLAEIETLSGLSGESYAKLLLPASDRVMVARTNLQAALKSACYMAFSYMNLYGTADFGQGMGSKETADASFDSGAMSFEFTPQAPLPQTADDRIKQVDVETARRTKDFSDAGAAQRLRLPMEEILRIAGYDEKRAAELMALQASEGVVPTEDEQL